MANVRTPADLGALARAARMARGWNQQEAAQAAGVSRRFVNMVEGGQHVNAEVGRVLRLLEALGVQLEGTYWRSQEEPAAKAHRSAAMPGGFDLNAHLRTFGDDLDLS